LALSGFAVQGEAKPVAVDLGAYRRDCGIAVESIRTEETSKLTISWPIEAGESGRIVLDTSSSGKPLLSSISLLNPAEKSGETAPSPLLREWDPVFWVTVGKRESPPDRPPGMSVFNVFFDSPAKRPYRVHRSELRLEQIRVTSHPGRATIRLEKLEAGPFSGALEITVYAQARIVQVVAAMKTFEDPCAYFYDAGLVAAVSPPSRMGWIDTEGRFQQQNVASDAPDRAIAVRHRTIVAESDGGAIACFPPPHQYFFPRDLTDNLSSVWEGRSHRGEEKRWGFGIRQAETGGGAYVPWFNAPPGTEQRMGVFLHLSRGKAEEALRHVLRYTHGDRFPELPGHLTLSSHWHMEVTVEAMKEEARGKGRSIPDLVSMFKAMGVKIVHLAEFHGQGHPQDPGPRRLPELEAMFRECRRLTDADILFLPGEEANVHLGAEGKGKHPGHWLYLFPKPVYWTMRRGANEPFAEHRPGSGTIYHVGNQQEMARMIQEVHGLAWTAHPRIKASNWAPDEYRREPFFRDPSWLGATWKAMPVDLSRPKLGERGLDLLDDMANWGEHKYAVGEVDVFKIDHTHELFGHMNVNYLRLSRLPRFEDDWQPILDALHRGQFFVTTGEVLIRDFQVGGRQSGETLTLDASAQAELQIDLDWTFPLNAVEIVSGDGDRVYRERIPLEDTGPFGHRKLSRVMDLRNRTWIRAEAWDVAANGAFTQPIWLGPSRAEASRANMDPTTTVP